jgi:hypothetical protein
LSNPHGGALANFSQQCPWGMFKVGVKNLIVSRDELLESITETGMARRIRKWDFKNQVILERLEVKVAGIKNQ